MTSNQPLFSLVHKFVVVPNNTLKEQWNQRIEEFCNHSDEWEVQIYQYLTQYDNIDAYPVGRPEAKRYSTSPPPSSQHLCEVGAHPHRLSDRPQRLTLPRRRVHGVHLRAHGIPG